MWFSPVRDKETVKLLRKVVNITDVVAACKDTGYEWFEQFLRSVSGCSPYFEHNKFILFSMHAQIGV